MDGTPASATITLGAEQYFVSISSDQVLLSCGLVELKQKCMSIFADYLSRNNSLVDEPEPDELLEESSEEENIQLGSKKAKKKK
ncbi:hypothetical protein O6H91_Y278200 [Diphasiastrum complanatum]|nr:hypothetical protein O6H91_Y278200 [Diphasiastrum complanatum]